MKNLPSLYVMNMFVFFSSFFKVPGLIDGLRDPSAQVCSIYGPETVTEVFKKMENTHEGQGIFTFPNSPVKCPGAPQKICYIAEDYWRRVRIAITHGNVEFANIVRNKTNENDA